jgi:hypothetical protein
MPKHHINIPALLQPLFKTGSAADHTGHFQLHWVKDRAGNCNVSCYVAEMRHMLSYVLTGVRTYCQHVCYVGVNL